MSKQKYMERHGLAIRAGRKEGNAMTYTIVNKASNRPIFAIGFCSCYSNKAEAEQAAAEWNKHRIPSTCEVKVIETK